MSVQFDEEKQEQHVDILRKKEEEDLAQILSSKYGVDYVDLAGITINTDALRLIPEEQARATEAAAFKMTGKLLSVAVHAPNKEEVKQLVKELEEKGFKVSVYMVSKQSLEKAWGRYKDLSFAMATRAGSLDISDEEIQELIGKVQSIKDIHALVDDTIQIKRVYRISKIIGIMTAGAIALGASDIHIEPEEKETRLRFRLDGVLVDIESFDHETYDLMLSRIKLLSGLKLNIKQNAQDGRFSVVVKDKEIEMRTSILPGAYGESIVMRVLNPDTIAAPLEDLGIPPKLMKIFEDEMKKPNGMILNTGPTGSGKTTTLYAFVKKMYEPGTKIVTIEDPIEYHLKGIVQTQVETAKGYTFAAGLRSTLRQDPDVILVGEIRDAETAEIAIHAALTGHLVFSTLHTNNAAGIFPRLIDLGINPKIMTSAISVGIAQRLIRRVCINCGEKSPIPEKYKETMAYHIKNIRRKGEEVLQSDSVIQAHEGGCEKCNGTGYKGRVALYEAIITDKNVEEVVYNNPSEREVEKAADHQNILLLAEDGVQKVLNGVSTIEELERVIDITPPVDDYVSAKTGA
ncbi:MAG: GspE/PulE family protein [Candidatus Paceibacterota bacterium]|jgi:type IV pilus assembly protein PilB